MRRAFSVLTIMCMVFVVALPAAATEKLDGPDPAIWLSDPDGDDGGSFGIEQNDVVEGSSGKAIVQQNGALISVNATGLERWHTYTMWVVYFNDSSKCVGGCNGPDLGPAGGGVIYGTGRIALSDDTRFTVRLHNGAGAAHVGDTPPPPFAFAPFEAGPNNEFHIVIRSHGPLIWDQVRAQLTTFGGGCEVNVGPMPEQPGDFPVPLAPGECGDVQLYVFK